MGSQTRWVRDTETRDTETNGQITFNKERLNNNVMANTKTNGATEMGVSLKPTDAQQMGLLDNFEGEITDSKFAKFNYGGKSNEVLALAIEIESDELEKPIVQYYSCGEAALKNYVILAGNTKVKPVRDDIKGLPQGSNAIKFLGSLIAGGVEIGFTEEMLGDDVSSLVGIRARFQRVANPAPKGVKQEKENTILLIEKVTGLPGTEKPKKAAAGQPKTTTTKQSTKAKTESAAAAVESATDDIETLAQDTVFNVLIAKGAAVTKQDIAQAAYQALGGNSLRNKVLQVISQDAFLRADGRPWQVSDKGMLSLGD